MARDLAPGTRLGRWRILDKLGQGGMGAVYRAEDELGRHVAVKVLLEAEAAHLRRFEREARAAAAIQHPNVATLFFFGQESGLDLIVLEFLSGGSLAARLRAGPLPWRAAAALFADVARGLEAVHKAGLIHRDLKPDNVLLDAEGRPKLTDFGLVRRTSTQGAAGPTAVMEALTRTGETLGTLLYVSPEQAERPQSVDHRADLYSLGATIHHALAGRPPFEGQGYALVRKHLLDRPPPLGKLVPGLPASFEELVLALLEKDPASRPASAAAVAQRLDAIAAGKEAPPRRSAGVLALVVAVALSAGIGGAWLARRPSTWTPASPPPSTATPPPSRPPSTAQPPPTLTFRDTWSTSRGRVAFEPRSMAVADGNVLVGGGPSLLLLDPALRDVRAFAGHRLRILCVGLDARGTRAVSSTHGDEGDPGRKTEVLTWDVASGRELHRRTVHEGDTVCAIAPDGRSVLSIGGAEETVVHWDAATGEELGRLPASRATGLVRFTPDGQRAIVGLLGGDLVVFDVARHAQLARVRVHAGVPRDAAFESDTVVWTVATDGALARVDLATGAVEPRVEIVAGHHLYGVALTPDRKYVIATGDNGTLERVNTATRSRSVLGGESPATIFACAVVGHGEQLLVGAGASGTLVLHDLANGGTVDLGLRADHTAAVTALRVSRDGGTVLSASLDGSFRIWNVAARTSLRVEASVGLESVAFGPDETYFAAGYGSPLLEFKSATAAPALVNVGANARVVAVSKRTVLVGTDNGSACLIDLKRRGEPSTLQGHKQSIYAVGFSSDGRRFVTGACDGKVGLWEDGRRTEIDAHPPGWHVQGVAFLDDDTVVSVGDDGFVSCWSVPQAKVAWRRPVSPGPAGFAAVASALAVWPEKRLIAASSMAGAVELLADDGHVLASFDLGAQADYARSLVFLPLAGGRKASLLVGTGRGAIHRYELGP